MYGRLLRRARSERGLTQVELAGISGVEQSNISAIENDRRVPTAATLHRLLFSCGYEMLAVAGDRVLAFPPPNHAESLDDEINPESTIDTEPSGSTLSMGARVRRMAAVLDASEAMIRGRRPD